MSEKKKLFEKLSKDSKFPKDGFITRSEFQK